MYNYLLKNADLAGKIIVVDPRRFDPSMTARLVQTLKDSLEQGSPVVVSADSEALKIYDMFAPRVVLDDTQGVYFVRDSPYLANINATKRFGRIVTMGPHLTEADYCLLEKLEPQFDRFYR